jgi:hypothetical protein
MNSRKAPPPVEQYDTSSLLINLLIADRVSPPPAIEKPFDFAISLDNSSVPLKNNHFQILPMVHSIK